MCGIAGTFSTGSHGKNKSLVERIVESQKPRGPDHQAIEVAVGPRSTSILGHNRLSIIDLSPQSNQPMWDPSGRFCIVFNGEIYNYKELRVELEAAGVSFSTSGDTEVLLEAFKYWGSDSFSRLNGMFAFAIWDSVQEKLWLARDRFGVKPCYFHSNGSLFVFASTTRALARELGLEPNLTYISRGLRHWIYEDSSDISPYEGLRALPSGSFLEVKLSAEGRIVIHPNRYYDLGARAALLKDELTGLTEAELTRRVRDLLDSAINLRLRSDVPIGLSLSSGLDSSSIAVLVAKLQSSPVGFTYGGPTAGNSEGPLVKRLADEKGIRVEFIWPDPAIMTRSFWETLEAQDAPFAGGSIVAQYLVFKAAHKRGFKVLLGGQGADEAFMGYHKYQLFRLADLLAKKKYGELIAGLAGVVPLLVSEIGSARAYLDAMLRYRSRGESPWTVLRLPSPPPISVGYDPSRPLWTRQMMDVLETSLPTLLRYEDRNSMGNSVESRLPFMDYRLIELGIALPEAMKVRRGYGKWIIRQAVDGLVPNSIRLVRYKKGFDVSVGKWIKAGLGASIRNSLMNGGYLLRDVLRGQPASIDNQLSNQRLATNPAAFREAITLCWLATRSR